MQAVIQYIEKELDGLYPKTEIEGFIRICIEHVCGYDYTGYILHKNEKIGFSQRKEIEAIIQRLKKYEPIQYITGETEFFGLKIKVNSSVLIPRPETEELVQWMLDSGLESTASILDIGTGSGCIALALKNQVQKANVKAVDISNEALKTAQKNAELNKLEVDFSKADILKWEHQNWKKYDVVVSNPPYVRELEKNKMMANVLEYEPENALFVADSDPLLFYEKITEFAFQNLNKKGWLYFEINEFLGKEMIDLVKKNGFLGIEIKSDLFGKERMLRCLKR